MTPFACVLYTERTACCRWLRILLLMLLNGVVYWIWLDVEIDSLFKS